jgi:ATP-dependent Clp protease ATP-binding subunit ClpA
MLFSDYDYVSVEHLVLAMFAEPATTEIGKIFKTFDLRREKFLQALTEVRGNQRVTSANPEATYEALEKYGRDLTRLAAQNKLDPVIGRDAEIRRCIQVLSRRTKNNPVLIGEPGVGETAIVELGQTHRIRRCARQPQREAHRGARSRGAHRGSEISGRIRRAAQGRAAAKLRTEMESMPEELESLERRILQLEIEREALGKEKDQASKERLVGLEKELANLKSDRDALKAQWEGEKHAIDDIQKLRTALELARTEMEQAQRRADLTRVAEYKYGKIPQLEQQLKEHEAKVSGDRTKRRLLQEEVTADEVAEVVSPWTGIPVSRLLEGEKEKLLRLIRVSAAFER